MKQWFYGTLVLALGCSVESTDQSTGGVKVADEICGGGVVAILSDYLSTQVALLDDDGQVLSESFISSGSTTSSGLAAPLSGDVTAPSSRSLSKEVVLLDRFGTNVITWVDAETAEVRAQLPVGSGFESNPRDYLELSPSKAYVPRWGENVDHGKQDYDRGGDVLIIDPSQPTVVGSIDLHGDSELPPRPSSITLIDEIAVVVLQRLSVDFATQGESELVGIDTQSDEVLWQLTLEGMKGCGRAMPSPSGQMLAVACTGEIDFDGNLLDPQATGIVLLDATKEIPEVLERFDVYGEFGFSPQSEIEFASEHTLLAKTQTPYMGEGNNQLFALDSNDGAMRVLAEAAPNEDGSGKGIVFGALYCAPSCGNVCLMTDGDSSSVRRFDASADLAELEAVSVGADVGLPPIGLGTF